MTARLEPTRSGERIVALDVLRGFALFGVFLANASASARPFEEAIAPPPPGAPVLETLAWFGVQALVFNKFVALFSLLFGMGLVLQMQRAAAAGRAFVGVYLRRLAILAGMGLAHGCLLFEGDILFVYSLVALALLLCRNLGPRALCSLALVPLCVGTLLDVLVSVLEFDGMDAAAKAYDEQLHRAKQAGPLGTFLAYRVTEYANWLFISSVISFNWRVAALFFFGAAAMKARLLEDRHATLHLRLMKFALPLGVAAEVGAVAFLKGREGVDLVPGVLLSEYGSLVLSAGYAGAVLTLVRTGTFGRLQRGLASVGRTALTNYLAQSVLMNAFFFYFGLGLYDRVSRAAVLALVTVAFAAQIGISVLWMRRFSIGPFEWVWRSLTYRKIIRGP
jgi:uncharacterized protein